MSDIDDLLSEIEKSKPEASAFADQMIADEKSENDATNSNTVDNAHGQAVFQPAGSVSNSVPENQIFDPEIHAVDSNGQPKRNKDGTLSKKRGRKSGTNSTAPVDTSVAAFDLECKNCAVLTVQTIIILGHSIGGEEWTAEEAEKFAMVTAWEAYYRAKGTIDLPPWIGVLIATGAYAMPRVSKPNTRTRLTALFSGVSSFLKRVKTWLPFSQSRRS